MADTGKQSPLGVNVDGNFLQNKGLAINAKVPTYVGISKSNDEYLFSANDVNLNPTVAPTGGGTGTGETQQPGTNPGSPTGPVWPQPPNQQYEQLIPLELYYNNFYNAHTTYAAPFINYWNQNLMEIPSGGIALEINMKLYPVKISAGDTIHEFGFVETVDTPQDASFMISFSPWPGDFSTPSATIYKGPATVGRTGGTFQIGFEKDYWNTPFLGRSGSTTVDPNVYRLPNGITKYYINIKYLGSGSSATISTRTNFGGTHDKLPGSFDPCANRNFLLNEGLTEYSIDKYVEIYSGCNFGAPAYTQNTNPGEETSPGIYCVTQDVPPQFTYRFFSNDADPVGSGRVRVTNLKLNQLATFIIPPFTGKDLPSPVPVYGFQIDWVPYGNKLTDFNICISECKGDVVSTPPNQSSSLFYLEVRGGQETGQLNFSYVARTGPTAANWAIIDPTKTYYVNILPLNGDSNIEEVYGISLDCNEVLGPAGGCQPGFDCPDNTPANGAKSIGLSPVSYFISDPLPPPTPCPAFNGQKLVWQGYQIQDITLSTTELTAIEINTTQVGLGRYDISWMPPSIAALSGTVSGSTSICPGTINSEIYCSVSSAPTGFGVMHVIVGRPLTPSESSNGGFCSIPVIPADGKIYFNLEVVTPGTSGTMVSVNISHTPENVTPSTSKSLTSGPGNNYVIQRGPLPGGRLEVYAQRGKIIAIELLPPNQRLASDDETNFASGFCETWVWQWIVPTNVGLPKEISINFSTEPGNLADSSYTIYNTDNPRPPNPIDLQDTRNSSNLFYYVCWGNPADTSILTYRPGTNQYQLLDPNKTYYINVLVEDPDECEFYSKSLVNGYAGGIGTGYTPPANPTQPVTGPGTNYVIHKGAGLGTAAGTVTARRGQIVAIEVLSPHVRYKTDGEEPDYGGGLCETWLWQWTIPTYIGIANTASFNFSEYPGNMSYSDYNYSSGNNYTPGTVVNVQDGTPIYFLCWGNPADTSILTKETYGRKYTLLDPYKTYYINVLIDDPDECQFYSLVGSNGYIGGRGVGYTPIKSTPDSGGGPGTATTSFSSRLGRLVQDTSLRLLTWAINDAYYRGKVTPANYDKLIYIGSDINAQVVPGNSAFNNYGSCTIPALGNSKPPTYIPYDPANRWTRSLAIHSPAPACTSWPFEGNIGQKQGASWFPYSFQSVNKSITQWGYFRLHALQAWNEFKYNASDTTSYPPQYKDFCASFMTGDAWINYNNQAVYAQDNSKSFLKGAYSGMNNLITGDIAGVCSGNFKDFGNDLIALGKSINLKTIEKFGYPSNLLEVLIKNNALTQDVSLALEAVGINQALIQQSYNGLNPSFTTLQEQAIYSAFLIITGDNLLPIKNLLNCTTSGIESLADLLSAKKLFPTSYTNLALSVFNSSATTINEVGAKTPFLIYNGTSVNNNVSTLDVGAQVATGEPQEAIAALPVVDNYTPPPVTPGSLLKTIIPEDDAVAAGALGQSISGIKNIDQIDIEKFAQIVKSLENAVSSDTPLVNGTATTPVDLASANAAHNICGSGSGPQGTFRMSDLFGNMSGLPYNYPEIFRLLNLLAPPPPIGTTHSGYSALFYVYQQNYLAVTWEKAHHTLQQPTGNTVVNRYQPPVNYSVESPTIIGLPYCVKIVSLGTTSQENWNKIAGTYKDPPPNLPAGEPNPNLVTYSVGDTICPVMTDPGPPPPPTPPPPEPEPPEPYVAGTVGQLFQDPITKEIVLTYPARYKLYYDVSITLVNRGGGYGRGQAPVPKVRIYPEEFNEGFSNSKVINVNINRDDLRARSNGRGTYGRVTGSTIDNGVRVYYYIPDGTPNQPTTPQYSANPNNVTYIQIFSATPPNQNICDATAQFKPRALYITTEAPPTDLLPVKFGTEQYPLGEVLPVGTNKPGDVYWHCGKFQENNPGWPNPMNDVMVGYINQANSFIKKVYDTRTNSPTDPVTSLNKEYEICGAQLMIEQRTRYFALLPVEVPYNDFANPYPLTIHSFVDSLPSFQQDTAPHMANQTLEHIADVNGYNGFQGDSSGKMGGQSMVAMGRQERNQARLQEIGIPLDNNIKGAISPTEQALYTMNGVIAGAVTGVDTGPATYTFPSWPGTIDDGGDPIVPLPSGRWLDGPTTGNGTKPGEIGDYFTGGQYPQIGPIVIVGADDSVSPGTPVNGDGSGNAPGTVIGTGPNNTSLTPVLPPNLDSTFTSSTTLPSNYSVQEAIDKVIECNCDCFVT